MTDEHSEEIRRLLDDGLVLDVFEADARATVDAATSFFQNLFVETLGFDSVSAGDRSPWQQLPVHEWSPAATANTARLVATAGLFRVVYVELTSLTRTAERSAILGLARCDQMTEWARGGALLVVFHAPGEGVWHLVTPFESGSDGVTDGRLVLRRFVLGAGVTHRTVANALASLDAEVPHLAARVHEAFEKGPLTEEFYRDYRRAFEAIRREVRDEGVAADAARRYAHVTLTRLVSLYYLQANGWFGDRTEFVRWFFEQYRDSGAEGAFHDTWLSALLFEGLNRPAGAPIDADLPDSVTAALSDLPYASVGLFHPVDVDECGVTLPDAVFDSVVREFLERYNFTATEEGPYDIDVAVDPAMLGKIYESLIVERERGVAGVFYTPRTEVDLLCRLALYERFRVETDALDAVTEERLVEFLFSDPLEWSPPSDLDTDALVETLRDVRVVDPACGSGAFLVGMLQVLSELSEKVGRSLDAGRRRRIVEENLYGVDIKDWAVGVAAFRLWLATHERAGATHPTTAVASDLSFNLYTGDSLVENVGGPVGASDPSEAGPDGRTDGFLWRRDFAGVLDAGGFDVVVTNPPYVGHQHIVQHHLTHGGLDRPGSETAAEPKSSYKDALVSAVRERFGLVPFRQSDLYLYFFFKAIDVLRDGGTLAFVTSNTWLDNSYGTRLQQGLLELTDLRFVVENRQKRSFANADVNTAITVATKVPERRLAGDVGFVAFDDAYERVLSPSDLRNLLVGTTGDEWGDAFAVGTERGWVRRVDGHRVARIDHDTLWRLGGGTTAAQTTSSTRSGPSSTPAASSASSASVAPTGTYTGNKWGQFLRAPSTYFELLEAGAGVFTPLSEVATVGSYLNTGGADDFFFVDVVDGDPQVDSHVTIRNRATDETFTVESEFVVPFVKSPRQVSRIDLSKAEYDTYLLSIPAATDLAGTNVSAYVEWGAERGYHTSSGRRSVAEWWVLGQRGETNTEVVWPNRQNARHFVAYNPGRTVTHRFYRLEPRDDVDLTAEELAALLNFSPTSLFTEVLASAGLGQGVLDVTGSTLRRVPVVDPAVLTAESRARVRDAFRDMCNREMGTLHDELGAQSAATVTVDGVVADRARLDSELFETYLGLDRSSQEAVYAATLRVVNGRLSKSRSV